MLLPDERRKFLLLTCTDVLVSMADIFFLAGLVWIVQFYSRPDGQPLPAFLPAWMNNGDSIAIIAVFLVLFAGKNLLAYLAARAHYAFMGRIAMRISLNNLAHYQQAPFSEFIQTDSSVHIRRIAFQPFEFSQYLLAGISQIITQGCLIGLSVTVLLVFNAKLFLLLLLVFLPPVAIVFYFLRNRLAKARKNLREGNEASFQHLLDALKGYVEGNIYHRNEFFLQRFTASRGRFSRSLFHSLSLQNLPGRVIEIFMVLGLLALIAWVNRADGDSLVTIGAFMAAAYKIIPGIVKIINIGGQLKTHELASRDVSPPVKSKTTTTNGHQRLNSLRAEGLNFAYNGKPILQQCTLEAKKGDFIGITGYSGIGKTTLLHLLLGFLQPGDGKIYVNDTLVPASELRDYWPSIAYVRQQVFLLHDTLGRNVTLEEQEGDRARLIDALHITGLESWTNEVPGYMDKIITENGRNISGGQHQRIALARALYKDADLILLDEPFNELDQSSVHRLLKHFQTLAQQGKMVIMVTHDGESLAYCNKIVSLNDGSR